jgi:hypothetical protein
MIRYLNPFIVHYSEQLEIVSPCELGAKNDSAGVVLFLKYSIWFATQHKLLDFPKPLM